MAAAFATEAGFYGLGGSSWARVGTIYRHALNANIMVARYTAALEETTHLTRRSINANDQDVSTTIAGTHRRYGLR